MTIGKKEVTFKWSNYTRPTPKNLERMAGAVRDILAGIAAMSIANEFSKWVSMSIAIAIIIVGQVVKFAASVADEEKQESAVAEFPSGEEITITKDKPDEAP